MSEIERLVKAYRIGVVEADKSFADQRDLNGVDYPEIIRAAGIRAVLRAMREPDEGMKRVLNEETRLAFSSEPGEGLDWDPAEAGWTACIDYLLGEEAGR